MPKSIQNLIEEFSKLPGIGPKSAQRLAMYLLHSPEGKLKALAGAIDGLKSNLQFCQRCWNIAEDSLCKICSNTSRNHEQICVVEEILDVVALEKTLEYKGSYHVLHGTLSPVNGIGPDQLKVEALVDRIKNYEISPRAQSGDDLMRVGTGEELAGVAPLRQGYAGHGENRVSGGLVNRNLEIILATNPGLEGETTAMYLMRLLRPLGVRVTRIARGLPIGGDLDYADDLTLTRAMQGRTEYN